MKQIVNIADAQLGPVGNGAKFVAEFASLGAVIGARKLGVSLCVVPPGKRAFPRHAHHVNEEMMFILDGTGTYRAGDETAPVRTGDLIAAPPGDGSTAHQIENTSDAPLRYLTFSTKLEPEVVEYPDSGKFGLSSFAGAAKPTIRYLGRTKTSLDYFDGEE
ncbi:MAG: cupin domain-containing protein [Paracoccaceae bacterium]